MDPNIAGAPQQAPMNIAGPPSFGPGRVPTGRKELRYPTGQLSTELGTTFNDPTIPEPYNANTFVNFPSIAPNGRIEAQREVAERFKKQGGVDVVTGKDWTRRFTNPNDAAKVSQQQSQSISTPLYEALQDIQVRLPHPSELKFFKQNKQIPAMMTEDGTVAENPYAEKPNGKKFSPKELAAVQMNEKIRVWLKRNNVELDFKLTPGQQKQFKTYGEPLDMRHTIIARILTGDPSAGTATPEQQAIAQQIEKEISQPQGIR